MRCRYPLMSSASGPCSAAYPLRHAPSSICRCLCSSGCSRRSLPALPSGPTILRRAKRPRPPTRLYSHAARPPTAPTRCTCARPTDNSQASAEQIPKITRTPVLLIVGDSDLLAPADVHAKLRPLLPTCERGGHRAGGCASGHGGAARGVSEAILDFLQQGRSSKGSL